MNDLLIGALSALLATNQPAALSNLVKSVAGISVHIPDKSDPLEAEYQALLEADDLAQMEVDDWIQENNKFAAKGAGVDRAVLNVRIERRFAPVRKAYEEFLKKHPDHARAHLAYGSFLNDIHEEEAAHDHWEKARLANPSDPAAWNNLANWYGHNSPVKKSFEYYEKAIELDPTESVYWHNLATTVYLFRHDATNYYKIEVQKVFEKAMGFYRKALELDPHNFVLATDYAQSYYGFKPEKKLETRHWDEAIKAWQSALELASDDVQRQGVYIHFARVQINAGRLDEARRHLNNVTNEAFTVTKNNLTKKIAGREASK